MAVLEDEERERLKVNSFPYFCGIKFMVLARAICLNGFYSKHL